MNNSALDSEVGRVSASPPLALAKRGTVGHKQVQKTQGEESRVHHKLKIGEVANHSEIPVKTIRYYEEIGLLVPATTRSESGYRLFNPSVLNRLAFIKRAQSLGLSLREIQELLEVHDSGELPCGAVKQHLLLKVEAITHQIEALEILKSELLGVLSGWQEQPADNRIAQTICPNIQPLTNRLA